MAKKSTALSTIDTKSAVKAAIKQVKQSINDDVQKMITDYIKGAYWLKRDIEKEIVSFKAKLDKIDKAIAKMEEGDLEAIKEIKIPAKYLDEKTVRMNNMDWRNVEDTDF